MAFSIRGITIQRSWVLLALALVIGGISAFGVKRYIQGQMLAIEERDKAKQTLRVLVPKDDLKKGDEISTGSVAVRAVPVEWTHANAITEDQFDRVASQRLAFNATKGQMLLWSMLEGQRAPSFSTRLTSGRRAITVPVDEINSISGMLQPGDRIDLMVAAKRDSKSYLFALLQNVVVMATGSQAVPGGVVDGKETRRTYTTITLEASPEDAQRVLAAREVGKLAALLRSPGDTQPAFSAKGDAMALLGLAADGDLGGGIPVLYGGKNNDSLKDIPPLGQGVKQTAAPAQVAIASTSPQPNKMLNPAEAASTLNNAAAAAVAIGGGGQR
jgi:pilus assembly protein CpaB